ncbi:MAG: monovalent cation/H(+) antiporter subunit G [Kiritimatiellae bacterium]|nr:monovalent cation/H(+) antiporter subunit G [Kiritimatiellia bacterium]
MADIQDIIAVIMVSAGAFFMLIGGIGIIRLPDFFARTHAIGKNDTLGIMLILGGLAVHVGFSLISVKLVIALLFVGLTNPTASHALAQSAIVSGLKPWFRGDEPDSGGEA